MIIFMVVAHDYDDTIIHGLYEKRDSALAAAEGLIHAQSCEHVQWSSRVEPSPGEWGIVDVGKNVELARWLREGPSWCDACGVGTGDVVPKVYSVYQVEVIRE